MNLESLIIIVSLLLISGAIIYFLIDNSRKERQDLLGFIKDQQVFYTAKMDYLLDRIQTGDPVIAHNLNTPLPPREKTKTVNLPAADGVRMREI